MSEFRRPDPPWPHRRRSERSGEMRNDMPEGGMRYVRGTTGIDTVRVNGEVVYTSDGGCVDVCPTVLATT